MSRSGWQGARTVVAAGVSAALLALGLAGPAGAAAIRGAVGIAAVPDAPTGLVGTGGAGQVGLDWVAPVPAPDPPITGYAIQLRITEDEWVTAVDNTGSPTPAFTVTGLTNGVMYWFRVAAINDDGLGAWSDPSDPVVPGGRPGPPMFVTAVAGSGLVDLTWSEADPPPYPPVTEHLVDYRRVGSSTWTQVRTHSPDLQFTVTGLTNGVWYEFRVAARNQYGQGAFSLLCDPAQPHGIPGPPRQAAATAAPGQATVTWLAPFPVPFPDTTGHAVQYRSSGGSWTTATWDTGSTDRAFTVTGLRNGWKYQLRVAARNADGLGDWSDPSNWVSPASLPGPPRGLGAKAGNALVDLTWLPPLDNGGSPVVGYSIRIYVNGGWSVRVPNTGSTSTSFRVNGLANGTTYSFAVAAITGQGTGPWSNPSGSVTPAALPGPPRQLAGQVTSGTTVRLTWAPPQSSGGLPVTSYGVYVSTNNATWTSQGSTAGLTWTVGGLTPGQGYYFKVTARTNAGEGPGATTNRIVLITVPGPPSWVRGAVGKASVYVTWSAPSSTGGSPVTHYRVEQRKGYGSWSLVTIRSAGSGLYVNVTGLTSGADYQFRVSAQNAAGWGPATMSQSYRPS